MRVWRAARLATFSKEVQESPLAQTSYDLRHAFVFPWLNGGVPVTQVAEWAGHSVEVLLKIYAKCLDGHDALARRRVHWDTGQPKARCGRVLGVDTRQPPLSTGHSRTPQERSLTRCRRPGAVLY